MHLLRLIASMAALALLVTSAVAQTERPESHRPGLRFPAPVQLEAGFPVLCVAISPDGKRLACTGTEFGPLGLFGLRGEALQSAVQVFDLATRKLVFEDRPSARRRRGATGHGWTGAGAHHRLAFSPDGQTLAWPGGNQDHMVYLWHATRGGSWGMGRAEGPPAGYSSVCFTADGKTVISSSWKGVIRLWDLVSGQMLRTINPGLGEISGMVLSPTGTLLACADRREHFALVDLATGEVHRRLTHPGADSCCMAFSPEGTVLVTTGSGSARLWDTLTGRLIREVDDQVIAVAFAPDGQTLALGTSTGTIHLWDLENYHQLGELVNRHSVQTLAFTPDGQTLVSAGALQGSGTILLWDVRALTGRKRPLRDLPAGELQRLWTDLGGANAAAAYRAIGAPATAKPAVLFLRERLRPVPALDTQRLGRLIADLDSDQFVVREQATASLLQFGRPVLASLRKALEAPPSLEVRRRLEQLVKQLQEQDPSAEELQTLRAVEVLGQIGTPEAVQLLQALSRGEPEAELTRLATVTLQRLARPQPGKP